jgi:hypothetical protein
MMKRSVAVIMKKIAVYLLVFAVGVFLGGSGVYYAKIRAPEKKARDAAQKQMEQMQRMVRTGMVTDVAPDSVTLNIDKSGDESLIGRKLTFKVDKMTTVQAGIDILNSPAEAVDLTKHLGPGITVDVLAEGEKALAVHWEAPEAKMREPAKEKM